MYLYYSYCHSGPGSHVVPTRRPWPFQHPWVHHAPVTNRPEITAETVKPTAPASSGNSQFNQHFPPHNQKPHVAGRSQTLDQLFITRLRNRYRQVKYT